MTVSAFADLCAADQPDLCLSQMPQPALQITLELLGSQAFLTASSVYRVTRRARSSGMDLISSAFSSSSWRIARRGPVVPISARSALKIARALVDRCAASRQLRALRDIPSLTILAATRSAWRANCGLRPAPAGRGGLVRPAERGGTAASDRARSWLPAGATVSGLWQPPLIGGAPQTTERMERGIPCVLLCLKLYYTGDL